MILNTPLYLKTGHPYYIMSPVNIRVWLRCDIVMTLGPCSQGSPSTCIGSDFGPFTVTYNIYKADIQTAFSNFFFFPAFFLHLDEKIIYIYVIYTT